MKKEPRMLLACCVLLFGCGHSGSDLNVQATWGKNLSALGITPIYPPKEDLYVGDILLYVPNPCTNGAVSNQPQSILLGSIPTADVQTALEDYYGQRQQLPETSKPPETKPAPAKASPAAAARISITTPGAATVSVTPPGQPGSGPSTAASPSSSGPTVDPQRTADAKNPIFAGKSKGKPFTRLRMTAFPDFSFSDFSSGGIGATVPVEGVNVSGGVSGQKGRQGLVSVSQVEEEMLPASAMYRLVEHFLTVSHGAGVVNRDIIDNYRTAYTNQMMTALGCLRADQHDLNKDAYIIFVSRVFYARAFNYQFNQSEAEAASLRAALAVATASAAASQTAPATANNAAVSANAAQAAADATASALKNLTNNSTPGGSTSIEVGSQGGLALKQTFDRPLAFGIGQPMVWTSDKVIRMAGGGV